MTRRLFDKALSETQAMWDKIPALRDFADFPHDPDFVDRAAHHVSGSDHFQQNPGATSVETRALVEALANLAPIVEWRHSYSEAETSADFLARYGWFELIGPSGHFHSQTGRVMFGYWGHGLWYNWHHHPAAELYLVLAGSAWFLAEGRVDRQCFPGETREHAPMQNHAMRTDTHPIFALAVWKGDGLAGPPVMGRA